jgi:lysophospholipase L1-like esterase
MASRPGTPGMICFAGDSITRGYGLEADTNWPAVCSLQLRGKFAWVNEAIDGQTVELMNGRRALYGDVDANIVPGGRWGYGTSVSNVLVAYAGTNDIAGGSTVAETIAEMTIFIADSFVAGWDVVILGSMLSRGGFSDDLRDSYNEWQAAQANGSTVFYSHFCDDPFLANTANTAAYLDQIHPTTPGAAMIASYMAVTINQAVGLP